jgi:hypothetical protein
MCRGSFEEQNLKFIGVLVRTVLQFGFTVQSSVKKDVEEG